MVIYSATVTISNLPRTTLVPSTYHGTKTRVLTSLMSKTTLDTPSTSLIVLSHSQISNDSNILTVFTPSWMLISTSKFLKRRLKRSTVLSPTVPSPSYMAVHTFPAYTIGSQNSPLNTFLVTCGGQSYPILNDHSPHSLTPRLSYPIHSRFSSEVPDVRSNQIWSTDLYQIRHNKLLHSYPVHIMLNTAYFLHLVYLSFWYISYAYFRLCLLIHSPVINFQLMFDF